ncbi:hypothetical protein CAPTEDRAFT_147618, partial [Capitella teleta]
TIDQEEVDKFGKLAQKWWDRSGEFGALHTMNNIRIPLVRDALAPGQSLFTKPLRGLKLLDVGCGGGILSEARANSSPLARLGASVTGLDASAENINIARLHAAHDSLVRENTDYICSPVEQLPESLWETYDAVVASEILEHVSDAQVFISSCCCLVKPGGSIFITSLNKTQASKFLAVFAAERILRIVPEGAHDWDKFVPIDVLQSLLRENGMTTQLLHGIKLNPFNLKWSWTSDVSMNYALHATKFHPES